MHNKTNKLRWLAVALVRSANNSKSRMATGSHLGFRLLALGSFLCASQYATTVLFKQRLQFSRIWGPCQVYAVTPLNISLKLNWNPKAGGGQNGTERGKLRVPSAVFTTTKMYAILEYSGPRWNITRDVNSVA